MEMTPRKEKILSSVVRDFVRSGEPVGSKAIAEEIGVSSATVRNEMSDLIDLGLLEQPHTSAGRIPSEKGYREYVDRLMTVTELSQREKKIFDSALAAGSLEPENLIRRAVRITASNAGCLAVATTPSGANAMIRAVQFVQTSRRSAMLLLMSSAGTMKNRVFRCDFDLTGDMMRVFFRAFNEKLSGKRVSDITPAFLQTMAASLGDMYVLVGSALGALLGAAKDTMNSELCFSGQMNLLLYPELEHRRIMEFLEKRDELVFLLGGKPDRVRFIIGAESGRRELSNASLIISRYSVNGQDAGALAILGPTRMDYAGNTAVLRYLSAEVGRLLTMTISEEQL